MKLFNLNIQWTPESTELVQRIEDAIRFNVADIEDNVDLFELAYVINAAADSVMLDIILEQKDKRNFNLKVQ